MSEKGGSKGGFLSQALGMLTSILLDTERNYYIILKKKSSLLTSLFKNIWIFNQRERLTMF